jgi:hypothetical protein
MSNFNAFALAVHNSFQNIVKSGAARAVVVDIEPDDLWHKYLAAFPEGSNPVFRVRTEHDCACCKQFIRRAGVVVGLLGDSVLTVWDEAAKQDGTYGIVARALQAAVKDASIKDTFVVSRNETGFGAKQSRSLDKATQRAVTWNHLYTGEIPVALRSASPGEQRGDARTAVQVFTRGLLELSEDAVSTVLGLIDNNALYRGQEHRRAVVEFQKMQKAFLGLGSHRDRHFFVWKNYTHPVSRFRNTVIGTLVQDLSEGQELERAVSSFETKVAPQNYKRTTALITPMMAKKALETIETLGLEPALERRLAVLSDVSVNDVLWVSNAAKPLMKDGVAGMLSSLAKTESKTKIAAEDISLDDFMSRVLPEVTELELFFSGAHLGNLMALTAPVHPEPKQLFRWDNDFAWSYAGNITDSIAERVRKAGGKVDGAVMRVSLSWFNYDDLDLHIHEPERGARSVNSHIFYGSKIGWTGGRLDVDMNVGPNGSRQAVENVVWSSKPADGDYKVVVHNFTHRETSDPGFVIEVENAGKLLHFSYNKQVRQSQFIEVAVLTVKDGVITGVKPGNGITASNISQERWGLTTERYIPVTTVMLSPNYWGTNAVGNKHVFFVLEGARADEELRGIYNEFLHPRLEAHRKVFEVIGDRTKCKTSPDHMAGLGFSSTKHTTFSVRAQQGSRKRVFNIHV